MTDIIGQHTILNDFLVVLVLGGAIQGVLLGGFLIVLKKGSRSANTLLGVLLWLFAYVSFINVLLYTHYLLRLPHLAFTQSAIAFVIAPVYYFYIKTLSQGRLSLNAAHLLHVLPFFIFLLLTLPFYLKNADEKIELLLKIYDSTVSLRNMPFSKDMFYTGLISQFFFYTVGIIRIAFSYKKRAKNINTLIIRTFVWFWFVVFLLALTRILFFYELKTSIALPIFLAFGMYVLAYWSLGQQGYFLHFFEYASKYKKAGLSPEQIKKVAQELIHILEHDRLFLDPGLTASKTAHKISISTHTLSRVINEELADTFYNLINRMRVEYAQKKLKDASLAHLSMEGIGNESGFKSKSSFYRAFKKFTGQTPFEFQNSP